MVAQNLPAGQVVQVVLFPNEYCPGEHGVGADEVTEHALPAGQALHSFSPARLYRPAVQGTGLDEVDTQA